MNQNNINSYLQKYPSLTKWINECPACHTIGYKPEMPEHIGGECSVAGNNIRKMLCPLEVDDLGFCVVCSKLRKK